MKTDQPQSQALLQQVLDVYRQPLRFLRFWTDTRRPLPEGIASLFDLALAPADVLDGHAAGLSASREELASAIHFFIHQVLLAEDNDAYRMLGLSPPSTPGEIKSNYLKLMRLYHPDRDAGNEWNRIYAPRINRAYHSLRSLDRRPVSQRVGPFRANQRRNASEQPRPRQRPRKISWSESKISSPRLLAELNAVVERYRPSPRWMKNFVFAASCIAAAAGVGFIVWNMLAWTQTNGPLHVETGGITPAAPSFSEKSPYFSEAANVPDLRQIATGIFIPELFQNDRRGNE